MQLQFAVLPGEYAVCRLPKSIPFVWSQGLLALVQSDDEVSLVCPCDQAPAEAQVEPGWRCLRVVGSLDFSLVGILAEVAGRLADAGVSIFAISTYNTDYILVKATQLDSALLRLREAGHRVGDQ